MEKTAVQFVLYSYIHPYYANMALFEQKPEMDFELRLPL